MSETDATTPNGPATLKAVTLDGAILSEMSHAELASWLKNGFHELVPENIDSFIAEIVKRLNVATETKARPPITVGSIADPTAAEAAQTGFMQGIEHAATFLESGASGWLRNGAQQIAALVRDSGKAAAKNPFAALVRDSGKAAAKNP